MNSTSKNNVSKQEVFHKDYNIEGKDNLNELPEKPAVFGIFAIIHETPVHPRYIGTTDNLRKTIKDIFENPKGEGLRKFMQGSWIQMICFELIPGLTEEEKRIKENFWIDEYRPGVQENGEYPEYSYTWPYDDTEN